MEFVRVTCESNDILEFIRVICDSNGIFVVSYNAYKVHIQS